MTKEERDTLAFYRTPEGEKVLQMSDLAYAEFYSLTQKEKEEHE